MRTIVLAGGGTGGHIFPGLAVAEELRLLEATRRCFFVCSTRPIDQQILGRHAEEYEILAARPFSPRPVGLAAFLWSWPGVMRRAKEILSRLEPAAVVTTGGFVAAPMARAAASLRVPVVMLNFDAVPGLANRAIARGAKKIFSSAPVEREGWTRVNPIARAQARPPGDMSHCRRLLGLDPALPTLLVTGASQGAQSIDALVLRLVLGGAVPKGWQVIHQCGPAMRGALRTAYAEAKIPAIVETFFDPMGPLWGSADVALSRCGAGSVAEAWAARVPTLFLPYPYHRDQHQRANAKPLEDAGGAQVIEDKVDPAANADLAGRRLLALMNDPQARSAMRAKLTALPPADGAAAVASFLHTLR